MIASFFPVIQGKRTRIGGEIPDVDEDHYYIQRVDGFVSGDNHEFISA